MRRCARDNGWCGRQWLCSARSEGVHSRKLTDVILSVNPEIHTDDDDGGLSCEGPGWPTSDGYLEANPGRDRETCCFGFLG